MLLIFKLVVVLIVGFIGGIIARKLKLPNVSGYLVLGLILGPSLGLIFKGYEGFLSSSDLNSLKFINDIALAFIAFSIGSEFNFKALKKSGKDINTITMFEVLFVVVIVFVGLFFIPKPKPVMIGYDPFSKNNLAVTMVLASMSAATAPAATLMVIRQYRAYGPLSKKILPVTALDDIYGIIVFGFVISFAQLLVTTSTLPLYLLILKPFIEVFASIIFGIIVGFILKTIINKTRNERDDLQVLSIIAILLTTTALALINEYFVSFNLSLSALLANMTLGTMITNFAKRPSKTFSSVNDFTTPIYILFFTLAGASLNLGILKNSILIVILALVFIITRAAGKYLGAFTGSVVTNQPKSVRNYLGIALLPQGGISLGLLVIVAAQMKDFYSLISTVIMFSILFFETSGPIFAKIAITKAGEIGGIDKLEQLSSIDDIVMEEA